MAAAPRSCGSGATCGCTTCPRSPPPSHADRVVPLFVLDDRLLARGRFPSAVRTAFMLGCLRELDAALKERGARLFVRRGRPEDELPRLAREVGASLGAPDRRRLALGPRPRRARDRGAARPGRRRPRRPGRCRRRRPGGDPDAAGPALHGLLPLRPRLAAGGATRPGPPPGRAARAGAPGRGRPARARGARPGPLRRPRPPRRRARRGRRRAGGSRASCAPTWRRTPTGATGRRAARRACPPTCAGAASPRSSSTAASPSRRAPARGTTAPSWPGATSTRRCSCTSRT